MNDQAHASRSILTEDLHNFQKKHPELKNIADAMIDFISTNPDCFSRSNTSGHLTGSAWLVNPKGDKVLLTLHRKLQRWMQTGGHADGEANPLLVAMREAEEESGIQGIQVISPDIFDIDIHRIPARPEKGEPEHYHYDLRYLLQAPHEEYIISDESESLAWWSKADIEANLHLFDESVIRMSRLYFGKV